MSATLIGVDWGTSNLRAFRFGDDGAVLETRRAPTGVSAVKDHRFEAALRDVLGDWIAKSSRIVISGMAGSREGWVETPYLPCPVALAALAASAQRAPGDLDVRIGAGLTFQRADGIVEIMRGEETQILGALDEGEAAMVIAPGTHSKWARVEAGQVLDTRTYMTGEVFALLKSQSILAKLIDGEAHDADAFALGARRGLADSALLNLVFSARSEGLFGHIAPKALAAYLSGLLIGSEIAEGLSLHKPEREAPLVLIGASEIAARYGAALELAGARNVRLVDGEAAAARGLWKLATT